MSLPRLLSQLASNRLIQRAMSSGRSQFTVEHEIAVKGFGKGTNDFVSHTRLATSQNLTPTV